jgi:hypothetical protein
MPSNLASFDLPEMLRVGRGIRAAGRNAPSMEQAFERIARYLFAELQTDGGEHACALVRCYKTHPFGKLQPSQQTFARKLLGDVRPFDAMQCLTLMATAGEERRWNDVRRSKGHRAIPLPAPEIVAQAPMIAQLISQFGLDLADVVSPANQVVRDTEGRSYGVFHVEHAVGSPFIPAQDDFVLKYGIKSVVGCGGHLRSGDLFAVILFSKVPIDAAAADRFRTLALDVKATLFPYDETRVFAPTQREPQPART